ncbi:MAG: patatin-like phospholipase family protein [Acidobacteriota bacterium]
MTNGRAPKQVVVALGGGGMRGVAHLGVLQVLAERGVEVVGMAGTSSGALLGALWLTLGPGSVDRVRGFVSSGRARRMPDFHELGQGHLWQRAKLAIQVLHVLLRKALLSEAQMLDYVRFFLPETPIEALPVPFVAVATDTLTGEEVWLSRGSLVRAVAASSAMPGLVNPIAVEGRFLQDGGAVAEIPVRAARSLGSPVLAVEVSEGLPVGYPGKDGVARAMLRAAAMGWQALRQRLLAEADFVIAPRVNHLHWADYHAVEEAVQAGREAAQAFFSRFDSGTEAA